MMEAMGGSKVCHPRIIGICGKFKIPIPCPGLLILVQGLILALDLHIFRLNVKAIHILRDAFIQYHLIPWIVIKQLSAQFKIKTICIFRDSRHFP